MRTVDGRLTLLRIYRSSTLLTWHSPSIAKVWVRGMRRYEGLRLRGNRGEDAFLLKALAIGAPSVIGGFKSRATNLSWGQCRQRTLFPPSNVPCAVCSNGTRWRSVALVPAEPGIAYEAVEVHVDQADIERTCREVDTCLDAGVAGVEVEVG